MRALLPAFTISLIGLLTGCSAQIKNAHVHTVHIDGDCPMCQKTIEKAAFVKGEAEADWDVDAKMARVTYDSTRTDLDAVLKRVALAGYDNERYLAPDAAYTALPGCCQYERNLKQPTREGTHTDHTEHAAEVEPEQHGHEGRSEQPAPIVTDPIATVFTHYFALKDALVNSNAKLAMKHAGELDGAMHSVDPEGLPEELRGTWAQVMQAVMPTLHPLSESGELAEQRTLFGKLTAPMLQLAQAAPQEKAIYLDHCPMFEGGADWLSQEKAIKNPFYGSQMLTCGSVKETIVK